jgi:hypothetical protein
LKHCLILDLAGAANSDTDFRCRNAREMPISALDMDLESLTRWPEFRNFESHSGPTMTLAGTSAKFAILAVLFFIGAFFSWKYFHERGQKMERDVQQVVAARTTEPLTQAEAEKRLFDSILKINETYRDRRALDYRSPMLFNRGAGYPIFAWLLFFLGLAPFFMSGSQKATFLAPVCVVLEGIAFGSTEALIWREYPGLTLLGLTLTAGLILSILAAFWIGLLDDTNRFLVGAVGVIGAIGFAYIATTVARTFGYSVEYLHNGPKHWWAFVPVMLAVDTAIYLFALRAITDAIEAGAPKWLEWRAAARIFLSFVEIAKGARRFLKGGSRRRWR